LQNELSPKVEVVAKAFLPSDEATAAPFHCVIRYLSTKDGKIENYVVESRVSWEFRRICVAALNSLTACEAHSFPEGTRFSMSWNEITFNYSGPGSGGAGVSLSREEMRHLMTLSTSEIEQIVKMPVDQIHQQLKQSKPASTVVPMRHSEIKTTK
jgi:hypothetical protein